MATVNDNDLRHWHILYIWLYSSFSQTITVKSKSNHYELPFYHLVPWHLATKSHLVQYIGLKISYVLNLLHLLYTRLRFKKFHANLRFELLKLASDCIMFSRAYMHKVFAFTHSASRGASKVASTAVGLLCMTPVLVRSCSLFLQGGLCRVN